MYTKIWTDEWFRGLSPKTQRVFLYLLTNPHSNMVGLYVLPTGYAVADLGGDQAEYQAAMSEMMVGQDSRVEFDEKTNVIFIRNYLEYNPIANANQEKGAATTLLGLPKSRLISRFLEHLTQFDEAVGKRVGEGLRRGLASAPKPESDSESDSGLKTMSGKPDASKSEASNGKPKTYRDLAVQVLAFLNSKTGRNYRPVDANLLLIAARLKSGVTVEQIHQVIARQCLKWRGDAKMDQYLRPATLFRASNFEQYLGELGTPIPKEEPQPQRFRR